MNGYQKKRVLALLDCEEILNSNEWDFINNLADNYDEKDLSVAQNKWLNNISERLRV